MRILQIIYSLSPGGAERLVVDLCNQFSKSHEVLLCTLRDEKKNNNIFLKGELSNGIEYVNFSIPEGFSFKYFTLLYKLIKKFNPDIVHCHLNVVKYISIISFFFKKIHFFYTLHTNAQREITGRLDYRIKKLAFLSGRIKVITVSKETSKSFYNAYKIYNFHEILNGRSFPLPDLEFEKTKCDIKNISLNNSIVFIHVSRCSEVKNQLLLINVFNRLREEKIKAILLIIGDGYDSPLGSKLKNMASNNIFFLGPKICVANFFLNADAFCLTSTSEGLPITLIEALACGCVPVCTPVGGIPEIIEHGVTGFISKSVKEEDYYNAITFFIEKKDIIIRDMLIEKFKNKFSIDVCANKYLELFQYSDFNENSIS